MRQLVGPGGILKHEGVDEALGTNLELCLLALLGLFDTESCKSRPSAYGIFNCRIAWAHQRRPPVEQSRGTSANLVSMTLKSERMI